MGEDRPNHYSQQRFKPIRLKPLKKCLLFFLQQFWPFHARVIDPGADLRDVEQPRSQRLQQVRNAIRRAAFAINAAAFAVGFCCAWARVAPLAMTAMTMPVTAARMI